MNECFFEFYNDNTIYDMNPYLPRSKILVGNFGHNSSLCQGMPLVIVESHKL